VEKHFLHSVRVAQYTCKFGEPQTAFLSKFWIKWLEVF